MHKCKKKKFIYKNKIYNNSKYEKKSLISYNIRSGLVGVK